MVKFGRCLVKNVHIQEAMYLELNKVETTKKT